MNGVPFSPGVETASRKRGTNPNAGKDVGIWVTAACRLCERQLGKHFGQKPCLDHVEKMKQNNELVLHPKMESNMMKYYNYIIRL
jgi:hypothetical protein